MRRITLAVFTLVALACSGGVKDSTGFWSVMDMDMDGDGGADLVLQAPANSSGTDVHGYGSDDTYWKVWLGVE